jgi:hypothetical protein
MTKDNPKFVEWCRQVDTFLFSHDTDLDMHCTMDEALEAFEEGQKPQQFAEQLLEM